MLEHVSKALFPDGDRPLCLPNSHKSPGLAEHSARALSLSQNSPARAEPEFELKKFQAKVIAHLLRSPSSYPQPDSRNREEPEQQEKDDQAEGCACKIRLRPPAPDKTLPNLASVAEGRRVLAEGHLRFPGIE